jgi:hypothetical protein
MDFTYQVAGHSWRRILAPHPIILRAAHDIRGIRFARLMNHQIDK